VILLSGLRISSWRRRSFSSIGDRARVLRVREHRFTLSLEASYPAHCYTPRRTLQISHSLTLSLSLTLSPYLSPSHYFSPSHILFSPPLLRNLFLLHQTLVNQHQYVTGDPRTRADTMAAEPKSSPPACTQSSTYQAPEFPRNTSARRSTARYDTLEILKPRTRVPVSRNTTS
jgi:hypothetical protein